MRRAWRWVLLLTLPLALSLATATAEPPIRIAADKGGFGAKESGATTRPQSSRSGGTVQPADEEDRPRVEPESAKPPRSRPDTKRSPEDRSRLKGAPDPGVMQKRATDDLPVKRIGPGPLETRSDESPPRLERHRARPATEGLSLRPVIENMLIIPDERDEVTEPGILAPGATVVVLGRNFGPRYGEFRIDAPGNYVFGTNHPYEAQLSHLVWEDERTPNRIQARVPWNITGPMDRTQVRVIVESKSGISSAPYSVQFQVPSESKWLGSSQVETLECGDDSNAEWCTNSPYSVSSCGLTSVNCQEDFTPEPNAAIFGCHLNCTAAVGNDTGRDRYLIRLHDGWMFERAEISGLAPSPPLPKGAHQWQPDFNWTVAPGNTLEYQLRVRIRRQVYGNSRP